MTEGEWLSCNDAQAMMTFLARSVTRRRSGATRRRLSKTVDRKLRLFFCGRCRGRWADLADERSRAAAETAEQLVDGAVGRLALWNARRLARPVAERPTVNPAELLAYWATWLEVIMLAQVEHSAWDEMLGELTGEAQHNPDATP